MSLKDLPSPSAPNFLPRVREMLHTLAGKTGSARDRALTLADAIESGVIGIGPGGSLVPGPEAGETYIPDLTPPPAPDTLTATPAISHILLEVPAATYTQGHGHLRTRVYGATRLSGYPAPVFADAVEVGQFSGTVWAFPSNPSTTWHFWAKWESVDGVLSATPVGGTNGVVATTGQDVSSLLNALAGQISSSELANDLATPIGKIPALESGLAQEIIDRAQAVASEASSRAAALAQEASNRAAAIQQVDTDLRAALATADAAVVSSLTSAYQSADAATLASAQSYTFSKTEINNAISAMGTQLTTNYTAADTATLASAQNFTYSRSAIDAADAATLSTLRSEFAAADSTTLATAQNYTYSKATIDSAIASSASTLRSQLTGGSTATDLNLLTSGLLYQERETRAAEDAALSQQITLLSAAAGDQFDYSNIWYYDSGVESWTTNGTGSTLSAVSGWLRLVSNSGTLTDRYFVSPDNLGINGAKYPQVRLRVRKVGNPTWEGRLYFITTANATYDVTKSASIAQPSYDANGISVVTFDMPASWTGATIRQIRFDASTAITPTDYFELDWVAVGRPSPGASSAQLTALQTAMMQADDALAQDVTDLQTDLRTLAGDLTAKADASALRALETRVTNAEGVNTSQGSSITSLTNSLATTNTNVSTAQTTANNAATAAANAQTSANTANTALADIASDSKLTPSEKQSVRSEWNVVAAEKAGINAQATTFAITTENTAYNNAFQALATYLNNGTTYSSGVPSWISDANLSTTTNIVGAKFRTNWQNLYTARTALLNRIALKAKELADAAQATANTKASASAFNALNTQVQHSTTGLAATATRVGALESTVNNPTTGVAATAAALSTTNTNVSNLAGKVSAQTGQITTIQSRVDRVVNYLIVARGTSATAPAGLKSVGFFNEAGTSLVTSGRSYMLVVLDGTTGAVLSSQWYDVFGNGKSASGRNAATLAADLNALTSDKVVVVYTFDEPMNNRLTSGLDAAMYRCGASRSVFGSASFMFRSAYILVGIPGIGEGGGIERYAGAADSDPAAYCDYTLQLINGRPAGLGGNLLNAAIQTEATTRSSETGSLFAKYTVKVDVAGHVSGYGLASTANNGAVVSQFGIRADQFFVAPPATSSATAPTTNLYKGKVWRDTTLNVTKYYNGTNWVTTPQALPFVVQASPTTINGVAVPAGVYMQDAFIRNGTITNAKIANLAVDDAKIANLSVSKLTAGSIAVGQYAQSTGYVAGSSGWRINGDGTAEFSGVVVRGTIFASQGAIGGWTIGSNYLQSTTYALGTSGTRLNSDGTGQIGGWTIGSNYLQSTTYVPGTSGTRLNSDGTGQIGGVNILTDGVGAGASSFTNGVGTWSGADGRWRVGNPFGSRIQWNGSAVEVYDASNRLTLASGEFTGGNGTNLSRNSTLRESLDGWDRYINTSTGHSGTFGRRINANGAPIGFGSAVLQYSGPVMSGFDHSIHQGSSGIPCSPGERLELQAYVQTFRGDAQLEAAFADVNGIFMGSTPVSGGVAQAFGDTAWSQNLADFVHLWGFVTVPAGAHGAYVVVRSRRTVTTINTDLYVARPYIGRARANQTAPTPWTEGPPMIGPGNVSTYLASAAIGSAQLADAAVGTLKIAGNAVTIPASAFTAAEINIYSWAWNTVQSVTVGGEGNSFFIFASASGYHYGPDGPNNAPLSLRVLRNGSPLPAGSTGNGAVFFVYTDNPGHGSFTYELQATGGPNYGSNACFNRSLLALGVKR